VHGIIDDIIKNVTTSSSISILSGVYIKSIIMHCVIVVLYYVCCMHILRPTLNKN
jgi:hypothetical protein